MAINNCRKKPVYKPADLKGTGPSANKGRLRCTKLLPVCKPLPKFPIFNLTINNPTTKVKYQWLIIIAFNLVPIAGVAYYDWLPFDMIWLFWMETLVLSFFNAVRVLYSQGHPAGSEPKERPMAYNGGAAFKFLLGRIGIFLFYSIFIVVFIGFLNGRKGDSVHVVQTIFFGNRLFNWALLLGVASQAFYLIKYFFMNGQYYYAKVSDYAVVFDGRQLVIHIAVVLGAVGSSFLFKDSDPKGYGAIWIIAIFCVVKSVFELLALNSSSKDEQRLPDN